MARATKDEAAAKPAPRFYCTKLRCTNPAANDVEITCPVCGRAYQRCFNHDGEAGARRSLRSHAGLYGHSRNEVR